MQVTAPQPGNLRCRDRSQAWPARQAYRPIHL